MKRCILLLLMIAAMGASAFCEKKARPLDVHQTGTSGIANERERSPISLPLAVYYDSDTGILEVWCDNDNIQAEIFVYDESGAVEAYSPYMNVTLTLSSCGSHSILIVGDGWEAEGFCE